MEQEEILNIRWHTKQLLLKALNKYPRNPEAAAGALGITIRTVVRMKAEFSIYRSGKRYYEGVKMSVSISRKKVL